MSGIASGYSETDGPLIPGDEEGGKAVVYRNLASGVRTYEHPSDEQYRAYYRSVKAEEEEEEKPPPLNDDARAAAAAAVPAAASSGGSRPRIQISISDGGDWAEERGTMASRRRFVRENAFSRREGNR